MPNTYPATPKLKTRYMTTYMADVSADSNAYLIPGFACKIKSVKTVLGAAITGANAVVATKINSTAVTGGSITITQAGSAAGDVDSCTPTAANTVGVNDIIVFDSDGASSTTAPLFITVELEPL
jgi:hypothetical protein